MSNAGEKYKAWQFRITSQCAKNYCCHQLCIGYSTTIFRLTRNLLPTSTGLIASGRLRLSLSRTKTPDKAKPHCAASQPSSHAAVHPSPQPGGAAQPKSPQSCPAPSAEEHSERSWQSRRKAILEAAEESWIIFRKAPKDQLTDPTAHHAFVEWVACHLPVCLCRTSEAQQGSCFVCVCVGVFAVLCDLQNKS